MRKTYGRFVIVLAAATLVFSASAANAYEQYSQSRNSTNCRECHGDFRASNYVDPNGLNWNANLHNLHSNTMLGGDDCLACHRSGGFFPVELDNSAGGTGFPAVGCVGCHGRTEDDEDGAGLRQHHDRSGVTVCRECHSDSDPANYTPVGENVAPPYYFTPDSAHPNKPTSPCNVEGKENYGGAPHGLDNDGDLTYDLDDSDCGTAPPTATATVPAAASPTATATATAVELTPTGTPTQTATVGTPVSTVTASPTGTAPATDTPSPPVTATTTAVTVSPSPTSVATASATSAGTSTPTPTGSAPPTGTPEPSCAGDCNDDNKVAINELIIGVNISFDPEKLDLCPSFDTSGNGAVAINELIGAVNNALDGCPET